MNTERVLRTARGIVEEGWCQGDNTDGQGRYCLRAAIALASGLYVTDDKGGVKFPATNTREGRDRQARASVRDHAAKAVVRSFLPDGCESIPEWNDRYATTKQDVLLLLDKAIDSVGSME